MRSTLRIDDDLISAVKEEAQQRGVSMTRMINRLIRFGLESLGQNETKRKRFREQPCAMGRSRLDLDGALFLAASLEDEEILRKISLRK